MNRIITLCTLVLLSYTGGLSAQTFLSGVINSYAKVTTVGDADPCAPYLTVDDASPFSAGDYIMVIQMKGAEIDTTDSSSFGTIINLNSAGLYEKAMIDYVDGNDIHLATQFVHNYDVDGSVQIVDIPQYSDATVSSTLLPYPWDGEKGGIIALEVSGTLTLNANIDASQSGFRGGLRDTLDDGFCNWTSQIDGYAFPDGNWQGDSKGEGIADLVLGKENGRAPQGTGGGGGNDHNSGGGGGSNAGIGGVGGQNLDPTPLACLGLYPGMGGIANPSFGDRLFLGGGGGAGHDNNASGSDGGAGGGIVYVKAAVLNANWQNVFSRGETPPGTSAFDGAGGGGAGGTILFDVDFMLSGLGISVRGGTGSDANALGSTRCMGPGGGGGAGVIFTDLNSPSLFPNLAGGQPGNVVNSTSICNGTSNNGSEGGPGLMLPYPIFPEGETIVHMNLMDEPQDVVICDFESADFSVTTDIPADNYQWQMDEGTGFTDLMDGATVSGAMTADLNLSGFSAGSYLLQCVVTGGCNDTLMTTATLEVSESAVITLQPEDQIICEGDTYILSTDAMGLNVDYQWQVDAGGGFADVMDGGAYSGAMTNTLTVVADMGMDGYSFQCVVANDCPGTSISQTATITVNPLPVADFTFFTNNDTLFVTGASSGEDTYYWDFGDGTPLQPGGAPYYVYAESGTYTVTVYAVNDCGTTSQSYDVTVVITTSTSDLLASNAVSISPNPTTGMVEIGVTASDFAEGMLYDLSGRSMASFTINNGGTSLDLSEYPAGVYILRLVVDGKIGTRKIIKQ